MRRTRRSLWKFCHRYRGDTRYEYLRLHRDASCHRYGVYNRSARKLTRLRLSLTKSPPSGRSANQCEMSRSTAAPASPKKTEIAVNETTALKTSDDGRKPTETDSPTHQSDDSALNKTEVTLVEETAPERVETPRKEIVRRGGRDSLSKKNTPTDKSLVEKKVRGAQKAEKPKRRVKSEKKHRKSSVTSK